MEANSTNSINYSLNNYENEEKSVASTLAESRNDVKSTAVVKYTAVSTPANFAQLQCNTDLKSPPSNWLSSSAESYGFQNVLSHSTGFSSFRLAHMFPDCAGEVDVISDSENVKRLLKIAYHKKTAVSMMIHRVENSLLIDEFDIHKHLLRQAENDWKWLRKFFYEHVIKSINDKEKAVVLKNNSRLALQQKALVSKFLHYSLVPSQSPDKKSDHSPSSKQQDQSTEKRHVPKHSVLPEPPLEEGVPDPTINHIFSRNAVWTFENIQMLLGIDMPIFGGSTHPCISLKLRDMAKPINVLTGIDYWLDNLMCNVPEVVMCYHLDGIVQRYELIKTEDLPTLPDSKFSPKLIRDVAQNILSFLKSNVTKAGHTYWLFKAKDDEVVKLYDLTSLCSEGLIDKGHNPFTVPVAMLMYRVGRNMMQHRLRKQPLTIKTVLKNCVSLLSREKYPQILTSSYYLLADLYFPATVDPFSPKFDYYIPLDSDESKGECFHDNNKDDLIKSFWVSDFLHANPENYNFDNVEEPESPDRCHYQPRTFSIPELCATTLKYVLEGLQCVKYLNGDLPTSSNGQDVGDDRDGVSSTKSKVKEEPQLIARPNHPIPMPYAPINKCVEEPTIKSSNSTLLTGKNASKSKKSKKKNKEKSADQKVEEELKINDKSNASEDKTPQALLRKHKAEALPTWQQPETMDNISWKIHLKMLLFEKAASVYAAISESHYIKDQFALSLSCIRSSLYCSAHVKGANQYLMSLCFGRAGDCLLQLYLNRMFLNLESLQRDFKTKSELDEMLVEKMEIDEISYPNDCLLIPSELGDFDSFLDISLKCYKRSLELTPCLDIPRKMGSVYNELGTRYINAAILEMPKLLNDHKYKAYFDFLILAKSHYTKGIKIFKSVDDKNNLALMHSNMGRVMRMMAHYYRVTRVHDFTETEKSYFINAKNHYKAGLSVLEERNNSKQVWDVIQWEISTTVYNYAMCLNFFTFKDRRPVIESINEVTIAESFNEALKYCDTTTNGPLLQRYQYRSAMIYFQLFQLYHNLFNITDDGTTGYAKRKIYMQLCLMNFEKAIKIMQDLEIPSEYFRLLYWRLTCVKIFVNFYNKIHMKLKSYQSAFELIIKSESLVKIIINKYDKTDEMKHLEELAKTDIDERPKYLSPHSIHEDISFRVNFESMVKSNPKNLILEFNEFNENRKEDYWLERFLEIILPVFKSLIKLLLMNPKIKSSELIQIVKRNYAVLLRISSSEDILEKTKTILTCIKDLEKIVPELSS